MPSHSDRRLPTIRIDDINQAEGKITIKPSMRFINEATNRVKPYRNMPYLFKPALERLANYVREEMIPETFEKEGPGWHPLSQRTQSQRAAAGYPSQHPILVQSGDLFESLTNRSHPAHIEIIKTGKYARVEIGSLSKKFIENQTGKGTPNLPARPMIPGTGFLGIPATHRKAMERIVADAIKGAKVKFRG